MASSIRHSVDSPPEMCATGVDERQTASAAGYKIVTDPPARPGYRAGGGRRRRRSRKRRRPAWSRRRRPQADRRPGNSAPRRWTRRNRRLSLRPGLYPCARGNGAFRWRRRSIPVSAPRYRASIRRKRPKSARAEVTMPIRRRSVTPVFAGPGGECPSAP